MIEIKELSKKYKNNNLFKNINLTLPSNKKILILGPNGCGKSVLLKLIVGYSKIDEGEILIDGKKLGKDMDFIPEAGVMINACEFMKNMSGWENLMYLRKLTKKSSEDEVMQLVKYFELQDDIRKKYKTYSLGMKQKLRIIQALMEKPNYLILDEPFDALDKHSVNKLITILNEYISQENHTLIFTTHNQSFEDFADIIYEIDNQQVVLCE